ncbi:MAG: DNA polymerase III subunit beta, partial [SAR202 cluster bacterium]|nr:DNA polymerase III subunit beta [SAR202 cluster bacterium]
MKITCLQENLSRGLAVVGRAVASRATLPVTQNVLLSVDQSMLKLSATNLEIAMTTWVGAMIEEEGSITVPARLLTEFVNSLPNDKIELELDQGSGLLHISSGNSDAHINTTDASEFPPIPTVDDGVAAAVDPVVIKAAIGRVAFAAATEESRPVLTGVEVKLNEGKFTMAAADGFRLAVHHGDLLQPVPEEMSVIIPARTMNELNRLIGDQEEPVEIVMTPAKGQVMFRVKGGDTIEIVSQLLQGSFPNYEQLIPQSYTTRAIMDLPTVLRAARTASIFARDGSNIIRMHLMPSESDAEPPRVEISARSEEVGDNQDVVDLDEIEGDEGKIAFNSRYLLDVLSVLEKGKV